MVDKVSAFIVPPTLSHTKKIMLSQSYRPTVCWGDTGYSDVELADRQPPVDWSLCRGTTRTSQPQTRALSFETPQLLSLHARPSTAAATGFTFHGLG